MNKFGKMRVIAAFTLALTMLASVAAPSFASAEGESVIKSFEPRAVEIDGENEALSGWQYYFYNDALKMWHYQSDELFVRATKNGRTGNAMEIERKKAENQLLVYSYAIKVEANTTYKITSFVKITDASGKLSYCVKEQDETGKATNDENAVLNTVEGIKGDWTETSFIYTTSSTAQTIVLRIKADGTGIMDIDDLTVEKTYANTVSYRMMSIGNDGTETPASYAEITADDIVSDSSDGDGKALRLNNLDVFTATLGLLPHGYNYEVSFKYKSISGVRMSFYLDNVDPSGRRAWYADGISGGSATEWTSYSYKFSAVEGQTDIMYFRLTSYGEYYIDEFEVKSLNKFVLNGSFENANYYHTTSGSNNENHHGYFRIANSGGDIDGNNALFNDDSILSTSKISADSADGDGKSVKLAANDYLMATYAPKKLDDDKTYTLSFKYKKIDSASGSYIRTRLDHVTVGGPQGWYGPDGNQGVEGEWVTYSYDFTTNANPNNDHVSAKWVVISAQGGEFLIDDISVKCKTFDDMQYMPNGSFSGAYTNEYQMYQNFNVAKQSDGTYVFAASSATKGADNKKGCFMRLDAMELLSVGKEYTLSFDYRSGGGEAVRVFYGISWGDKTLPLSNILSCTQATVADWIHKEVTFTHQDPKAYLEIYGDAGVGWPTYFRNISIKDAAGNEFITNKTLVAPDKQSSTIYTANFGAGSADYTWKDWNIVNGGIYGLTFEDGNKDYKVCLNGSAGNPATAVTKDIDVAGARLISVDKKIYFTEDSAFGSNLTVTVLAGENEIKADKNGYFSLPEGTTTVKIKFSTEEYVTFKKVFVKFTCIGTAAGASIRANTPYGIRWTVRVKTAEWNKLVEAYGEANVKAGVIIAPLEYLGSGETAVPFTIDAFKAANLKYVDIVTDTFNAKLENKVEGYSGFYASLVNIKAGNLNREFIARSYVAVTKDGVTAYYYGEYSAKDNARTIYEVGKGAIASDAESENVKTFVKNEVLDKIADVTVKDGVAAMTAINGYTSPYSVSINGEVLTITVMDGADVNLSEVLKIVCVNGKNYKPAVSGNLATVTIN